MACCQPQLLLSEEVTVVAAPVDDPVDQRIAVVGDVCDEVSSVPEGVEDAYGGGWGVHAHGVADAGVLGGVIAEDNGQLFFGVGLHSELGLVDSEASDQADAVLAWHVALQPSVQS